MRAIRKCGNGGFRLVQAHQTPPLTAAAATRKWGGFSGRDDVKGYLLSEQYALCCYSEIRADLLGLGYHIEHVENKSQNPQRTFEYANLAACAIDKPEKAQDKFGGHATGKQQGVDMVRFISPHQPNCASYFVYRSDGEVEPNQKKSAGDQARADYTIKLLNLNCPTLVAWRRDHWDRLSKQYDQHLDKGWDLNALAFVYLVPSGRQLDPFFSVSRQLFGRLADRVLDLHAADLV